MCVLILTILFYKITFFFLNNIIDSFKSNVILTNFFTIFLQTVLVANFYWFTHGPTTHIIFLLTSNHPLIISVIYKKVCNASIFLILMTIKKIIDLKSKTKYISPKKIAQQEKLLIVKLKQKKRKSSINQFYLK